MRFSVIFATVLIGTAYFFVGSAIAGADDNKKELAVNANDDKAIVEVKEVKAASDSNIRNVRNIRNIRNINNPFIRRVNNPFFFRNENPFFFNEDEFFAD